MKKRPTDSSTLPYKQLKLSEVGKVQPKKKLNQVEFDKANLKLIIDTVSPFYLLSIQHLSNIVKLHQIKFLHHEEI